MYLYILRLLTILTSTLISLARRRVINIVSLFRRLLTHILLTGAGLIIHHKRIRNQLGRARIKGRDGIISTCTHDCHHLRVRAGGRRVILCPTLLIILLTPRCL